MRDWLIERGYDPQDPKLALGWLVLARLDRSGLIGELSPKELVVKLGERQKQISITLDGTTYFVPRENHSL